MLLTRGGNDVLIVSCTYDMESEYTLLIYARTYFTIIRRPRILEEKIENTLTIICNNIRHLVCGILQFEFDPI